MTNQTNVMIILLRMLKKNYNHIYLLKFDKYFVITAIEAT